MNAGTVPMTPEAVEVQARAPVVGGAPQRKGGFQKKVDKLTRRIHMLQELVSTLEQRIHIQDQVIQKLKKREAVWTNRNHRR